MWSSDSRLSFCSSVGHKWEKGIYPKWFQDISWQYVFVERRMDCQALKTLLSRFKKILTVVTLVCEHFLIFDKHMQFYHHNYQKKSMTAIWCFHLASDELWNKILWNWQLQTPSPSLQTKIRCPFYREPQGFNCSRSRSSSVGVCHIIKHFHSLSIPLVAFFL